MVERFASAFLIARRFCVAMKKRHPNLFYAGSGIFMNKNKSDGAALHIFIVRGLFHVSAAKF